MIISFALLLLFTIQISNQKPSQEICPHDLSHSDTSKDDGRDYIAHPPSDAEIDYIAMKSDQSKVIEKVVNPGLSHPRLSTMNSSTPDFYNSTMNLYNPASFQPPGNELWLNLGVENSV